MPVSKRPHLPLLYCVPKSAISTCIREITQDNCGDMAADLVQDYLLYMQHQFGQTLQSAGLNPNICDNDISGKVPGSSAVPQSRATLGIIRLLETAAHGTALDTAYGKDAVVYLQTLSGAELCTTSNAYIGYLACMMSTDDKSDKSKFNIVQFAHQIMQFIYNGSQCSGLGQFTACWDMLQEICGPKVRGFQQHATLLVESCKIQSEMESVGCQWQDMILPYYIQASRVTVWPTATQGLLNPMFLDDAHYGTYNNIAKGLETMISQLQPGVEEIARKCGAQPADRLRKLFQKLRYLQLDALNYIFLLQGNAFHI